MVMTLTLCAAFVLPFAAASHAYAQQRPAQQIDVSSGINGVSEIRGVGEMRGVLVMTPHRSHRVNLRTSVWTTTTRGAPDQNRPDPAFMGVKLTDLTKLHTWYASVRNPGQASNMAVSALAGPAGAPQIRQRGQHGHETAHLAAFTVPGARGPPTGSAGHHHTDHD
ncbi:hypothetical protein Aph01nite_52460 [Acrocarpospora phusangensis]|uniref:CHRD domain-containing protein n=1 Tax=Acrocarpospora phusangensis TaxID=1070424 RepID=A0A919QDM2_9ACTN|nr:hypothetical protein [Acrocarpospora phusangensis]GIH26936.1 hypothetical protein Aph01nite_52460 [Acrocarpospora phusangensis]